MYKSDLSVRMAKWHSHSVILSDSPLYLADMTMVDIQVHLCVQELGLRKCGRTNNIVPLAELQHRKFSERIIMHTTSSLKRKNWPSEKFVKLSKKLIQEGYQVDFIVSKDEWAQWSWVQDEGIGLPKFSSLHQVACYIYESGYFIGNDSGIGHLASNLNIPTVSIILRKGVAKQWRPTWSVGKVVLSPQWLNPRPIKEKLWKHFTRVSHVKKAFDELVLGPYVY
jgi:ADP-heptose:LPS heptosyltransferase